MLREFARKLIATARAGSPPIASAAFGTLSEISQLPTPLYGEVEGVGPVTLLADANMIGLSPVTKCVDSEHEVDWIPTDKILLTDPRVQPVGRQRAFTGSSLR